MNTAMKRLLETRADLLEYLATRPDVPRDYRIAVGLLLFTPTNKVVLLKRGKGARDAQGQFEGVGGSLDDKENNLLSALQREVSEEIGDVKVVIDQALGVKILPGENRSWWVVVDYLGRLVSGTPKNMESHKAEGVYELTLGEAKDIDLSIYQRETMKMYQEKFGDDLYYSQPKSTIGLN